MCVNTENETDSETESQYDVVADGSLVFSKQREGRFPEDDEVLRLLRPPAA